MIRHMDAADAANRLENELNLIIDEVENKLEQLTVEHGDEVLRMAFLEDVPFNVIAKKFHYSRQGIYKVKDRALEELDRIIAAEDAANGTPAAPKLETLGECG